MQERHHGGAEAVRGSASARDGDRTPGAEADPRCGAVRGRFCQLSEAFLSVERGVLVRCSGARCSGRGRCRPLPVLTAATTCQCFEGYSGPTCSQEL